MRNDWCRCGYAVLIAGLAVGCGSTDTTDDASARDSGMPDGSNAPDSGMSEPPECEVEAPTACPEPPPRYADVAPIFEQRCIGCHDGALGGPWPLNSYGHAADWHDIIRAAMLDCSMPPPESGMTMTTAEREQLLTWIRCGFPK